MKNALYMVDSVTNRQMNSFIITTETGHTLLVDGGYADDAENLLDRLCAVTGSQKPRVDAWLLTHPHTDHLDAFCKIMQEYAHRVDVEAILCNFPDASYCAKELEEWGRYEPSIEEFNRLLPAFQHKVRTMEQGELYRFGEIELEVLYVPSHNYETNYINNSSVITRVTLEGKTVLFLGDMGKQESRNCLAFFAGTDRLRSDYVQMSHHGQNGAVKEFYQAVSPSICLWCTPEWLWNNDAGQGYNTHKWKTIIVRGWMEEMGVKEHYVMKDGFREILL